MESNIALQSVLALRYIFGLLSRLMPSLHIGDLTDRITLNIARSMLVKLARARIERNDISATDEAVLRIVVQRKECIVTAVAKEINKSAQYVGKT